MRKSINGYRIFFALAVLIFLFVNILTLKDGHNWGDDFSQYILHAKNIIEHKEYSSRISLDMSVKFPPGYPLLIAPIIKYKGVNFKLLKSLNIIFWILFILSLYPIFCKYCTEELAFLNSLYFLSSPFFFHFKQSTLSDIPFLFFCTFSILSFTKYEDSEKSGDSQSASVYLTLFFISMGTSLLFRSAGIALFIAAALYFAFIKKNRFLILMTTMDFLIISNIQNAMGASSASYLTLISWNDKRLLLRPLLTFITTLDFFFVVKNALADILRYGLILIIQYFSFPLFILILSLFLLRLRKKPHLLLKFF